METLSRESFDLLLKMISQTESLEDALDIRQQISELLEQRVTMKIESIDVAQKAVLAKAEDFINSHPNIKGLTQDIEDLRQAYDLIRQKVWEFKGLSK
jgi:ElaB/YqjD/DUF883 family membrane-anchored ribosome-binding protein